jgi:GABA(A) receptor-associated protein
MVESIEESKRVLEKYPDKIPIVVNKSEKCKELTDLEKNKYIVPNDMTVGQFIYVVRKKIKLNSGQALFFFCNNLLIPNTANLQDIYNKNKCENGFLYIEYSSESTFG